MKKNIYTDELSKISTPDKVLAKGLESIRSAEPTDEVINFKEEKAKKKWFKPLGVVAAVLAVIIGLNTAGVFNIAERNPFILTAYAQQLNTESFVKVGCIKMSTGSLIYTVDDDGNEMLDEITPIFDFDVVCEGEGLKEVTYSTSTGRFLVNDSDEAVLDYSVLTDEEKEKLGSFTVSGRKSASDCVVAYDDKAVDSNTPLFIAFKIHDAKNMYEKNMKSYGGKISGNNIEAIAEALFNESEYTYNAQVTATFADGSKVTEILEFKCEHDENGYYLAAKIVE
ncbi:MAG: hypothetical protein UD936_09570 [Acutalibacteraceae bacterium]|nr:hypothetical protein [Acutalibacteraceae bacterium]